MDSKFGLNLQTIQ